MVKVAGQVAREKEGERLENKVEGLTKRDGVRVNWPRLGLRLDIVLCYLHAYHTQSVSQSASQSAATESHEDLAHLSPCYAIPTPPTIRSM